MKAPTRSRVQVVIPALNEEPRIGRVVSRIRRLHPGFGIIVVDDGSSDGTCRVAAKRGASVVRHPRNRGVGAALRTGFRHANRRGAHIIVVMGGDDQDHPEEIPILLREIEKGYDFVQGSRWLNLGRVINIPMFRRITTIVYSALFTLLTGKWITDGTNGFRAMRAELTRRINLDQKWLDTYELEPYLYYQAIIGGYRVGEAPVTKRYPRSRKGYTKMIPIRDWWRILKPLIMLSTGLRT